MHADHERPCMAIAILKTTNIPSRSGNGKQQRELGFTFFRLGSLRNAPFSLFATHVLTYRLSTTMWPVVRPFAQFIGCYACLAAEPQGTRQKRHVWVMDNLSFAIRCCALSAPPRSIFFWVLPLPVALPNATTPALPP